MVKSKFFRNLEIRSLDEIVRGNDSKNNQGQFEEYSKERLLYDKEVQNKVNGLINDVRKENKMSDNTNDHSKDKLDCSSIIYDQYYSYGFKDSDVDKEEFPGRFFGIKKVIPKDYSKLVLATVNCKLRVLFSTEKVIQQNNADPIFIYENLCSYQEKLFDVAKNGPCYDMQSYSGTEIVDVLYFRNCKTRDQEIIGKVKVHYPLLLKHRLAHLNPYGKIEIKLLGDSLTSIEQSRSIMKGLGKIGFAKISPKNEWE